MNWADNTLEYILLHKSQVPRQVENYIHVLENQETDKCCSCIWKIHPDDVNKPEGQRRKIKLQPNDKCTLHSKIGFILGFFVWVYGGEEALVPVKVDLTKMSAAEEQAEMLHTSGKYDGDDYYDDQL